MVDGLGSRITGMVHLQDVRGHVQSSWVLKAVYGICEAPKYISGFASLSPNSSENTFSKELLFYGVSPKINICAPQLLFF